MNPQEILNKTRECISYHAGSDRDKWFYANRFVFARLQLDERKTKTDVKKRLFENNPTCHYCKESIENKAGVHLHRLDGERGPRKERLISTRLLPRGSGEIAPTVGADQRASWG